MDRLGTITDDFLNNQWTITIGGTIIATVIIGIGALALKKLFGEQKKLKTEIDNQSTRLVSKDYENSSPEKPKIKGSEKASAGYILVKKMDEQAPYMREQAEGAYVGQTIEQKARYINVRPSQKDGLMRISLVSKEGFPWIYGDVDLNEYPWLKTLNANEIINVEGVIAEFSGHQIELTDVKLNISS